MSEQIIRDLADRLEEKMHLQMADYVDLCNRADCDMKEVVHHMIAILVRETVTGMLTLSMNRKEILNAVGAAHDIMQPRIEKMKKAVRSE